MGERKARGIQKRRQRDAELCLPEPIALRQRIKGDVKGEEEEEKKKVLLR